MKIKTETKIDCAAIIKELRKHGASVQRLAPLVKDGVPDLLVSHNGTTLLVALIESDRGVPVAMAEFSCGWQGRIAILQSPDQVSGLLESLTGGR